MPVKSSARERLVQESRSIAPMPAQCTAAAARSDWVAGRLRLPCATARHSAVPPLPASRPVCFLSPVGETQVDFLHLLNDPREAEDAAP